MSEELLIATLLNVLIDLHYTTTRGPIAFIAIPKMLAFVQTHGSTAFNPLVQGLCAGV